MHAAQGCAELCFIMENKSCEGVALHQLMHDWDFTKRQAAKTLVSVLRNRNEVCVQQTKTDKYKNCRMRRATAAK